MTLLDAAVLIAVPAHGVRTCDSGGADPALAALAADTRHRRGGGRLADWDHTTPTGIDAGYDAADVEAVTAAPTDREVEASVAATIYSVWRGQYVRNVIDAHLRRRGSRQPAAGRATRP